MQYANLVSQGNFTLLGEDPFHAVHFTESSASWHGQAIRLLSGHSRELSTESMPRYFKKGCLYALYVDVDVQVSQITQKTASSSHPGT